MLVILSLYTALFAAAGRYDHRQTGSVLVLAMTAIPALMILLLTAPRSSREYLRRGRDQQYGGAVRA